MEAMFVGAALVAIGFVIGVFLPVLLSPWRD